MAERRGAPKAPEETSDEKILDPAAVDAFAFLTNKNDYNGMTYDEIMESGAAEEDYLQRIDHH